MVKSSMDFPGNLSHSNASSNPVQIQAHKDAAEEHSNEEGYNLRLFEMSEPLFENFDWLRDNYEP
jgi:hypothetical protein